MEKADGECARCYFHGRTRHVDGSTKGYCEAGYPFMNAIAERALQCYRNRGRRRRRAQSSKIGWQHIP